MNKTTKALKLAEEALHNVQNALLFVSGSVKDNTTSTMTADAHDDADKALDAIREALAEPVKQELNWGINKFMPHEQPVKQEPVAEGYMKCPACSDRGVIRKHFTELERMLIEDAFDAQDAQMEHERFCQMVSDGYWPNYKGVDCDDLLEK